MVVFLFKQILNFPTDNGAKGAKIKDVNSSLCTVVICSNLIIANKIVILYLQKGFMSSN